MKPKDLNLVAGRLGRPSASQSPESPRGHGSTYGVRRLGIVLSQPEEPAGPLETLQPEAFIVPPEAVAPAATDDALYSPPPEPAATTEAYYDSDDDAFEARRKKMLVLIGSGGAALVGCVLLVLWLCAGGASSPQAATAVEETALPPKPLVSPPAPAPRSTGSNPPAPALAARRTDPPRRSATPSRAVQHARRLAARSTLRPPRPAPKTSPAPVRRRRPPPPEPARRVTPPPKKKPVVVAKPPDPPPPAPVDEPVSLPEGIELSCIMSGLRGRIAIISNRAMRVGKSFKGVKVVKIGDFSVEVEYKGKPFNLGIATPAPPPTPDPPAEDDDPPAEEPAE